MKKEKRWVFNSYHVLKPLEKDLRLSKSVELYTYFSYTYAFHPFNDDGNINKVGGVLMGDFVFSVSSCYGRRMKHNRNRKIWKNEGPIQRSLHTHAFNIRTHMDTIVLSAMKNMAYHEL